MLTIICTNRPDAIDPAVARRAAHISCLERPHDEQRRFVLTAALADAPRITEPDIAKVTYLLGPTEGRPYGATYSDLRQRFVPDAVLDAYGRNEPLSGERLIELAEAFRPTRPFGQEPRS